MAEEKLNILEAQLVSKKKPENVKSASPSQVQLNTLLEHYQNGRFSETEKLATSISQEFPKHQFAWKILGAVLGATGRKSEAVDANQTAVALTPQDAEAQSNLGVTLQELGRLDEAEASLRQAIALKPDYAESFWNLHSTQKTIQGAEHWIDKCLIADTNHLEARLTKAARYYQGDSNSFDGLMQSEFKKHPDMRLFSWAFRLPNLPELHFNQ